MQIRQLLSKDINEFIDVRLEGLQRHPECFGASFQEEHTKDLSYFQNILKDNVVFGVFINDMLSGIFCYCQQTIEKSRHKSHLWGMYVRATARKKGVADLLVDQAIEYARACLVKQLYLSVVSSNSAAVRLYERKGFTVYGVEPDALYTGGFYYNELLMCKQL